MYTKKGNILESDTMCVLDFYVLEDHQRRGIGKVLFAFMLDHLSNSNSSALPPEKICRKLAYDRPSPKLTSFLARHYGLIHPDAQPNRYHIYEGFFD